MKFNALTKLNFLTKKHPWFGLNILLRQTDVIWQVPTGLFLAGCRTVSNNGSGSGLAPAQNILAVQVWFGFT